MPRLKRRHCPIKNNHMGGGPADTLTRLLRARFTAKKAKYPIT